MTISITRALLEYLKGDGITGLVRKYGNSYFQAIDLPPEDVISSLSTTPLKEDEYVIIDDALHDKDLLGLEGQLLEHSL